MNQLKPEHQNIIKSLLQGASHVKTVTLILSVQCNKITTLPTMTELTTSKYMYNQLRFWSGKIISFHYTICM